MKTCPVCALELEDTYLFCPDDGSNLAPFAGPPKQDKAESLSDSFDETAGAVVLYCPACAAEYPLTFSQCPVHGIALTRHRIPRPSNRNADLREPAGSSEQAFARQPRLTRSQSRSANQLTRIDLSRPQIESPREIVFPARAKSEMQLGDRGDISDTIKIDSESGPDYAEPVDVAPDDGIIATDQEEPASGISKSALEPAGFRKAAIATVVALVVLGLVAFYMLASLRLRKPAAAGAGVASQALAPSPALPFVPTPQEAQDYKEPDPVAVKPAEPQDARHIEGAHKETVPAFPAPRLSRPAIDRAITKTADPTRLPAAMNVPKVANPAPLALPRGNSGGFDARLVRVRGRRTTAGYRYDLTFNIQEQAGRSAQWQRVLINTRSASGISHSEAIPFVHRLGASGALTFTISVELAGRSEPDWQGRVVCTTLGWDNRGGPLQTSFGANVTP